MAQVSRPRLRVILKSSQLRFRKIMKTKTKSVFLLIPTFLILAGCGANDSKPEPDAANASPVVIEKESSPAVKEFCVWRPFFFTSVGNHATDEIIGSTFAIKLKDGDQTYLLTALHLLGPETGLKQQIEPGEIRKLVDRVVISDAFGATDTVLDAGIPLELNTDVASAESWLELDALMLPAGPSGKRLEPLLFSATQLSVGDSVWLCTAVFGGAPASDKTHRAIVTAIGEDGEFAYEFANEKLSLEAADGAPLLGLDGAVVGMHLRPSVDSDDAAGVGILTTVLEKAFENLLNH